MRKVPEAERNKGRSDGSQVPTAAGRRHRSASNRPSGLRKPPTSCAEALAVTYTGVAA